MAKKATRLHFTEDELANSRVKKAASKAERAADKADRAAAKTPKKRKLKLDADKAVGRKAHLTFEKQEIPVGELTGRGQPFHQIGGSFHSCSRVRNDSRTDFCQQPGR